MSVNPDFRDLFAALNAAGADFLIVGFKTKNPPADPRML
jgi:hypothetical protein